MALALVGCEKESPREEFPIAACDYSVTGQTQTIRRRAGCAMHIGGNPGKPCVAWRYRTVEQYEQLVSCQRLEWKDK